MEFRKAEFSDWEDIASLHAKSWQENYRNILSDQFLDNEVIENRNEYWKKKLQNLDENILVELAIIENELVGFSCTYAFFKNTEEHYLDHIHVKSSFRGNRIGEKLLFKAIDWAFSKEKKIPLYLLVYEENSAAIRFYKRMGAEISEPFPHENDDGSVSQILKCTWTDLPLA